MSDQLNISPGMRVICRDAEWLVTRVCQSDAFGKHWAVHCVGADDLVRGHPAVFLTQLDQVVPVDPSKTSLVNDSSTGYRLSKLFLEARLRRTPATGITPDFEGMGAFKPMQFQKRTVELALHQLRPRLLLADAVGLGKTIQVGMILTELIRRGRADRILVLTKKSMLAQFQAELWNRFGIPLVRLDSAGIARLRVKIPASKNPFEVYQRIIISLDTLKNVGRYRHFLENTRWDCVVIDEAHNVAGASVPEKHKSYRLARLLSRRTDSMILTTATPHNGMRQTFGRLISLLDRTAIPDPDFKEYTQDDIRGFYLMRFKADHGVRQDVGQELPDRRVVPLTDTTVEASAEEIEVYRILSELRDAAQVARARKQSWANDALVQYGIYKQFLSSPEACATTVAKRLKTVRSANPESPEACFLSRISDALNGMSICDSSRYALLRKQLETLGWKGSKSCPRILIFTEYRETQDALALALARDFGLERSDRFEEQATQVIATIHGSCPDVHLMKTVEAFGTGTAAIRMLIATDVVSEGINLHHECHDIIHYDLPWSIITLIQRNGRIDRIGQTRTPVLRYLRVLTREGLLSGDDELFRRLVDKVEEINRSTRAGEEVLKLYDPDEETKHFAQAGLLARNLDVLERPAPGRSEEAASLEATICGGNLGTDDAFARFLLGGAPGGAAPAVAKTGSSLSASRVRLFSDREFFLEGYRYLAEVTGDYRPVELTREMILLTAPLDLKRRLGAPDQSDDVVFGATAIPEEAWPEHDQFRLTDDPARVELAIKAARQTSGYWSRETLMSDQHPIMLWLADRLLMQLRRGECPLITSKTLETGELCFCFTGMVSSKSGVPLMMDSHAISFFRNNAREHRIRPLKEALDEAGFTRMVNDGRQAHREAATALVPAAVNVSVRRLKQSWEKERSIIAPVSESEEARLKDWCRKRRILLESRMAEVGPASQRGAQYQRELDELGQYEADRLKHWRRTHLDTALEPSTQLLLVIEGSR